MIDPGHPFSVPYQDVITALEDSIRNGVEQPDSVRFIYKSAVTTYELPKAAYAVSRVTGLVNAKFTIFVPGRDYTFANNRISWLHPTEHPGEGSRFEVEYTYRVRPAGLTDFNPGSVIGTLVRAVAREMKVMYEQMDQAYRRAFIDQATGVALDNVAALLGVSRNQPLKALGFVTFLRKKATNRDVTIPVNTRVADESGRIFVTTEASVLRAEDTEMQTVSGGIVKITNRIAELIGIWRRTDPDAADPCVTPATSGLTMGTDERTITIPAGACPDGEVRIRYKSKSVTVPVEASQPGPEGNVNSGAVVIMPTPPSGVDGVVNEAPIEGGQNAEPDDQFRERAKHALERAGNATLNALKFAVLGIDGVEGVEVVDHTLDESIPLGEVRVRFSGGDVEKVRATVEQTRAAGILAAIEIINKVLISGSFYLIPDGSASALAADTFIAEVTKVLDGLVIGEPLSLKRLNALAYGIGGLADTAEGQLRFRKSDLTKPGMFIEGDVTDPLLIRQTELVRPDKANLRAVMLAGLAVTLVKKQGVNYRITLQTRNTAGEAVSFRAFTIDLAVSLKAKSLTAPEQPPERIGSFTRSLSFTNSASAVLVIAPADTANFRPGEHDPKLLVEVAAAAYPVLQADRTTIELS